MKTFGDGPLVENALWPEPAPSRPSGIGGIKGHNMKKTFSAHILFATGVPGKPRPVGGELHKNVNTAQKNAHLVKDHLDKRT